MTQQVPCSTGFRFQKWPPFHREYLSYSSRRFWRRKRKIHTRICVSHCTVLPQWTSMTKSTSKVFSLAISTRVQLPTSISCHSLPRAVLSWGGPSILKHWSNGLNKTLRTSNSICLRIRKIRRAGDGRLRMNRVLFPRCRLLFIWLEGTKRWSVSSSKLRFKTISINLG